MVWPKAEMVLFVKLKTLCSQLLALSSLQSTSSKKWLSVGARSVGTFFHASKRLEDEGLQILPIISHRNAFKFDE